MDQRIDVVFMIQAKRVRVVSMFESKEVPLLTVGRRGCGQEGRMSGSRGRKCRYLLRTKRAK